MRYKISLKSDYEVLEREREEEILALCARDFKTRKSKTFRAWINYKYPEETRLPKPRLTKVQNIEIGDFIVEKINYTEIDYIIDLTDYIGPHYKIENGKYQHIQCCNKDLWHLCYLNTDLEFCKWIGLFVADGTAYDCNERAITITSHRINNIDNHRLCESVMPNLGNLKILQDSRNLGTYHRISNKILAEYIQEHCKKLEHKKLPDWTMLLSIKKQKKILAGMCMGDGCYVEYNKKGKFVNATIYSTISETLAKQIKTLCKRIGLVYSVHIRPPKDNKKPSHEFTIKGNIAKEEFHIKRFRSCSLNQDRYYYTQVKKIERF